MNTDSGQYVRNIVQGMWVDFAKDGVIDGQTQYDSDNRTTITFNSDETVISEEDDPLSQQRELITLLLPMKVSGREIINAINAGDSEDPDPDPEDPDTDTETENKDSKSTLGNSGSGCNVGMFPFMLMLSVFIIKRH